MATGYLIEQRNIVVIGKTGAGKSTVANKILGRDVFPIKASTESATSIISHKEATLIDPRTNVTYKFKVVDTMGVFDTRDKIANKTVTGQIKNYIRQNIPEGISIIMFVFREGRFTAEEKAAFDVFMKNFTQYTSDISALVITQCESKNDDGRREVIQDFKTNKPNIARFMKKAIYAVGFPDTRDMKPGLRAEHESGMEEDAGMLRNLIINAGEMRLQKEIFDDDWWDLLCSCCAD